MRGPSGQTSLPSFVALGHLLREIIATSGSYYGVTGPNTGQFSVPSATLSPEAVALRRHIALLACVPIGPNKSCQVFVALGHLLREIIATSGSYYGVTGPIRAS
ncbi:hypothetical protein DPMN_156088 [Dreissena polymorpha]|uniref:Uncharacterized protein n=1 Tax=Dreissena polymorpha TaxID=45954 RepID=A0A9D4FUZ2_DREPO|nr:hypothetical protein DPMN_156088 [Dreissena polymorpha]